MLLCLLHHAAFNRLILGVRPDYIIRVRADVLEEVSGPMLRHGFQGQQIVALSRRMGRVDEGGWLRAMRSFWVRSGEGRRRTLSKKRRREILHENA